MPRVLKDIKINEVSGVDRGAGEGVRVVLMKRLDTQESEMTQAELAKMIADGVAATLPTILPDLITKATADVTKASKDAADALAKANAEIAVLKMSTDEQAFCEKNGWDDEKKKTFAAKKPEDRKAEMEKADSTGKLPPEIAAALTTATAELAKRDTTIADMQKRLAAHDEREQKSAFEKRATDMGLKAEDGETVRKAYSGDAEAQKKLDEKVLGLTKSLKAAQEAGGIFKEFGAGGGSEGGATAYDQLVQKATELRKTETALSAEQAFSKVYTDPANKELAMQYRKEDAIAKRQAFQAV